MTSTERNELPHPAGRDASQATILADGADGVATLVAHLVAASSALGRARLAVTDICDRIGLPRPPMRNPPSSAPPVRRSAES